MYGLAAERRLGNVCRLKPDREAFKYKVSRQIDKRIECFLLCSKADSCSVDADRQCLVGKWLADAQSQRFFSFAMTQFGYALNSSRKCRECLAVYYAQFEECDCR